MTDRATRTQRCHINDPLPPVTLESGHPTPPTWMPFVTIKRMEVGQSVFLGGKSAKQLFKVTQWYRVRYGMRFTARTVDGGVRVWCVEKRSVAPKDAHP